MLANPKNNEKIIVGVVSLFMAFILGSYAQFVWQIGFSYPAMIWEELASGILGSVLVGIFVFFRNRRRD
ncbi:hypothetical protein [Anaerospora hongkongensis]|uniref:hypothetical protein n=1 Tax=Anaerospora hongkongensis TaxID=244830 RepID=UPI0028966A1B|nr:hypothetical protein [Anaerospora hongkongensis]